MTAPPLDAAFVRLLVDPRLALRRPPPGVTLDQYRAAANRFMAMAPAPSVHALHDVEAGKDGCPVRIRLTRPSNAAELPLLLFVHGGGFILGNLDSHDSMARTLALRTNAVVASVDYRLAPEHPFPAAIEDCTASLAWLHSSAAALGIDGSRIAVAGDSAGGQLAIVTALWARVGGIKLRHLALLYPLLDPTMRHDSMDRLGKDYMLTREFVAWAWEAYGAAGEHDGEPMFDLADASIDGLPATTIVTAQYDPLRDEGDAFAARLRAAGIAVEQRCFEGMIHGFAGLPHITPRANEALDWVGAKISEALAL